MSSPLLKFHQLSHEPLDTGVLAAAVEASPDPMALVENGKLIYTNRSFAQLSSFPGQAAEWPSILGRCRTTEFMADGRRLSLTTLRREVSDLETPDSRHQVIIGRLAGEVAHDFNNLLTGILLCCDLLQSKAESGSSLERKIAEIQRVAEQGAALIRQLMTLGRQEYGAPDSVFFDQVVQDLESLLRHLLGEHIQFTVGLAQDSGLVGISLAQAQQIILNLALNARDAMPSGGRLKFESHFREVEGTGPAKRFFEFTVSDTGQGMDNRTVLHAFDPFFTTKASGRGTGTGLATVREIVQRAGGIVLVETSPGRGTQMTIRLPEVARNVQKDQPLNIQTPCVKDRSENRGASL